MSAKFLIRIIRDNVEELFGDYGSGMISSSLVVKYFSPATSTAIIRVARAHYRLVWAALTCITKLPSPIDQSCVFQVVRISGTIKKAEEEAIRRARLSISKAHRTQSQELVGSGIADTGRGHSDDVMDLDFAGIVDPDDSDDEEDDIEDGAI